MLPRTKAPKIREDDERDAAASPEASVLTPERPEGEARQEHETTLPRLTEGAPLMLP